MGIALTTDVKGCGAELLVQADLILKGYITHSSDLPGSPYDLISWIDGSFRKIQVKARTVDLQGRVRVDIRKSNGACRYYTTEDCEIIAVVETDLRLIAYLPPSIWSGKSQITLYVEDKPALVGSKTKDIRYCFRDYKDVPA